MAGVGFLQTLWEKVDLGGRLALVGSDGQCVFTHSVQEWNVPGSTGRMASSFSS